MVSLYFGVCVLTPSACIGGRGGRFETRLSHPPFLGALGWRRPLLAEGKDFPSPSATCYVTACVCVLLFAGWVVCLCAHPPSVYRHAYVVQFAGPTKPHTLVVVQYGSIVGGIPRCVGPGPYYARLLCGVCGPPRLLEPTLSTAVLQD